MISISALFSEGWARYREGLSTYIPLSLITILPALLFTLASSMVDKGIMVLPLLLIGMLINLIAGSLAGISLMHAVSERGASDWSEYVEKSWPFLGKYILVEFMRGILVLLGFILFIIPGILLLVKFVFAEWIVIFEGLNPVDALARSREHVKDKWRKVAARLFAILLASGFFMGLSAVIKSFFPLEALKIGFDHVALLFFVPWVVSMMYVLYDDARRSQSLVAEHPTVNASH